MVNLDGKPVPIWKAGAVSHPVARSETAAASAAGTRPDAAGARSPGLHILALSDEAASQPPPIDGNRVAELQRAIAQGELRVDPDAIARAFLADSAGDGGR